MVWKLISLSLSSLCFRFESKFCMEYESFAINLLSMRSLSYPRAFISANEIGPIKSSVRKTSVVYNGVERNLWKMISKCAVVQLHIRLNSHSVQYSFVLWYQITHYTLNMRFHQIEYMHTECVAILSLTQPKRKFIFSFDLTQTVEKRHAIINTSEWIVHDLLLSTICGSIKVEVHELMCFFKKSRNLCKIFRSCSIWSKFFRKNANDFGSMCVSSSGSDS